jgi:hypothetical protein
MDGSALRRASENDRLRVCGSGGNLADESSMRFPPIILDVQHLLESSQGGP